MSDVTTTPSGGSSSNVATGVTYHPFGAVKGFTLGNSQAYARTVDTDGRIASYTLGGAAVSIGFDAASRITSIGANTYGYDTLDRLTSAVLTSTTFGYSYDGVGNRLTKTVGANTDTYTYGLTSNRIATLTPASGPARSFTLDANGSTTNDAINTYVYDVRGRMVQSTGALGTTDYQVNALGQRIRRTNATLGDTVFTYDAKGHLIAESTAAGATLREYVWLGDIPLALIDSSGTYYVHADHLNTPRHLYDASANLRWRWDQDEPFGVNAADENPSSLGVVSFPLRFPGQYADKETNLNYNYFRDYDSGLGRYLQTDPAGLIEANSLGLEITNLYAYVDSSPLESWDSDGARKRPSRICSAINIVTHLVCDIPHRCTFEMKDCVNLRLRQGVCWSCYAARVTVQKCHGNRGTVEWDRHEKRIQETRNGCKNCGDVIQKNCC